MIAQQGDVDLAQLARIVQQLRRHDDFADVMQQAGQPGFAHQLLGKPELTGQRHHQRAHRQGMHGRILAGGTQPRQADQGMGMAIQRGADLVHQLQCRGLVQRAALAHGIEQLVELLAGIAAKLQGPADFLVHARPGWRRQRLSGGQQHRLGISLDLLDALPALDVHALVGVDPQLAHRTALQAAKVTFVLEQKARLPEGVIHPRAAQLVDIHAHCCLADRNAFERHLAVVLCRIVHWPMASWSAKDNPGRRGTPVAAPQPL